MGRKANWPPKVTVHKQSGTERVRYLGRDYTLGPAGSAQARAAYAALLAKLSAEGHARQGGELTLAQACQLWRVEALARYGEANPERTEHDLAWRPVLELFAALSVGQFSAGKLEEVRDRMVSSGLCRNVANRRVVRLRTAWRWLERRGHAPAGSWAALRALEPIPASDRRARPSAPVRPAQWRDVAAACRRLAPSPRALLLCLWYTGARPSELFGLRVGQLAGSPPVAVELARHKTAHHKKGRVLVFGPRALKAVESLLKGRHPEALVFPNQRGNAYNRRSFYLAVRRACALAGVRLHPYQLRHSAATRLAAAFGVTVAQQTLGHADLKATQIYAERDTAAVVEAMRRVG